MWVELGAGVVEECVDELHDFPFIILDKWSGATGNLSPEVILVNACLVEGGNYDWVMIGRGRAKSQVGKFKLLDKCLIFVATKGSIR